MIKIRKSALLWGMILVSLTAYVVTSSLYPSMASLFFGALYASVILCAYDIINREKLIPRRDPTVLVLAIVMGSFLGVLVRCETLSFSYFTKLVLFNIIIMMIFIVKKSNVEGSFLKLWFWMIQIICFVLFYNGFFKKDLYGTTQFLSLGFSNSNLGGMWCFVAFVGIVWSLSSLHGFKKKAILLSEGVALMYLVFLTGSRSSMISMLGICVCPFIKWLNSVRCRKFFSICSLLVPMIFPLLYITAYNKGFDIAFGENQGKSFFSGRHTLWKFAMEQAMEHPILGAYNEISYGTGTSNMHNIVIDILASYGVVVLFFVILLISWVLLDISKNSMSESQNVMFYGFLMALIQGTFEAALFTGSSGYGACCCIFLLISKSNVVIDRRGASLKSVPPQRYIRSV